MSLRTPHQNIPLARLAGCLLLLLVLTIPFQSLAQTTADGNPERERAFKLFDQNKFSEAIPIMEKLLLTTPSDIVLLERLGWATFVVAGSTKDPEAKKQGRARALGYLTRARDLGDDSELLRAGLEGLSSPEATSSAFSFVKEADAAMRDGEEAHAKGDLDKAISNYERALSLDPKLYLAPLFIGDMYFKKGYQATEQKTKDENFNKAGEWFARAIAIEPNSETAHRYWGDALMQQGKQEEAKAKFIDAIIADPGNRNGYLGLSQWGERNRVRMAHPAIEVPEKFDVVLRDRADGSRAWEHYGKVRAKWVAEDFAKAYPNETYRHSVREETEGLRKSAEAAAELLKSGKVKELSPSLAALVELNEAGLLEPYIFFNRADQGIATDYPGYRSSNRDKLRRYWVDLVIQK
jgi:tetratricopeptide (TPR) repeat protein